MVDMDKVISTQKNKPSTVFVDVDTVYVRSNIELFEWGSYTGWEYDETQYSLKEYISLIGSLIDRQDRTDNLSSSSIEKFEKNINNEDLLLYDFKGLKIESLKEFCSATIYNGFEYKKQEYGYNEIDQINLTNRLVLLLSGLDSRTQWKSKSGSIAEFTPTEFKAFAQRAEIHKLENQRKFWNLSQKVKDAESKEDVIAVEWIDIKDSE